MTYYHYTTKVGMEGIVDSRCIKKSTRLDAGDDVRYGEGVYLTTVPPSAGRRVIVIACWGRVAYPAFANNGRVDYAIQIKIPAGGVKKTTPAKEVYLYKGDLYLDNFKWNVIKVPQEH